MIDRVFEFKTENQTDWVLAEDQIKAVELYMEENMFGLSDMENYSVDEIKDIDCSDLTFVFRDDFEEGDPEYGPFTLRQMMECHIAPVIMGSTEY